MLRTNQLFLDYTQSLYQQQQRKEDIVIKHYHKGQKLFSQKENPIKIMVVKEGITKCFFTENNDKEYILEFLGTGEVIGEIEHFRHIPCLCNVEAITAVTVYAFSIPYFESLLKKDIALNGLLLKVFAERVVNTASRASYQQLYTIEYSLRKILELQLKQELVLSKEDMAAYLGISVRSLNRGFKALLQKDNNISI